MSGSHSRSRTLWEWLVPGLIGLLPLGIAIDPDIAQAAADLRGPKARHGRAGADEAAAFAGAAGREARSGGSASDMIELTDA